MEKWPNCENKAINDMMLKADFLKGPVRHNYLGNTRRSSIYSKSSPRNIWVLLGYSQVIMPECAL